MNKENFKYFKVVCKCGHVGRRGYVPIQFPIRAESAKKAAAIARQIPRVKHNHKDAILDVCEIDYELYITMLKLNENNKYLRCSSKQEQKRLCDLENLIVEELHNKTIEYDTEKRKEKVKYKLKKMKEIKKSYEKEDDYEYCY